MQPDEHLTPVIFKLDRGTQSPVAFFPQCPGTRDPATMLCYSQTEQHACASVDYYRKCKPATPDQYTPLRREIEAIGYKIAIRRRTTRADHIARFFKGDK